MVNNVREKLVKVHSIPLPLLLRCFYDVHTQRLQAEVLAWHRLCHRNVSQLFGIVQSPTSIAMVSQWCSNGTLCSYTRHNPAADRLGLVSEPHPFRLAHYLIYHSSYSSRKSPRASRTYILSSRRSCMGT